jgi:hypothetical protein
VNRFTVVYDACVLYPAPLRDLLMRLALTDLYRARWSVQIHEEWIAAVLRNRPDLEAHLFGNAQVDPVHPMQSSADQGLSPVLDHKDQMDNEPRNAVPTSSEWWLRHYTATLA